MVVIFLLKSLGVLGVGLEADVKGVVVLVADLHTCVDD
tara:strand:- start:128 stop:241 length:114 start_codon:yes stop_codon:yes gene_type:complete